MIGLKRDDSQESYPPRWVDCLIPACKETRCPQPNPPDGSRRDFSSPAYKGDSMPSAESPRRQSGILQVQPTERDSMPSAESPRRQSGDTSGPAYSETRRRFSEIPPTEVGGWFKSCLRHLWVGLERSPDCRRRDSVQGGRRCLWVGLEKSPDCRRRDSVQGAAGVCGNVMS